MIITNRVKPIYFLLGLYALLLFPLTFFGYGADNDTYGVLSAAESTWGSHIPAMSRNPGYWLYEFLIYFFNSIGGFYLTNFFSLLSAILVLSSFDELAQELKIQYRTLLLLCLALNPWFIIASTSTMDYMPALLLIVWSFRAIISEKFLLAGALAGLAIALRLGSIFPLAGMFIVFVFLNPTFKKTKDYALTLITALGITLFFYFPSWYIVGMNFSFMQAGMGDKSLWTFKMYIGRFFYKTIYLFGLPTFLYVIAVAVYAYKHNLLELKKNNIEKIIIGAILGNLFLFAKYPIEISYLIPGLFFFYLLIGVFIGQRERLILVFCSGTFIFSVLYLFLNFSLAQPNIHNLASDAKIRLKIERGILWVDLDIRRKVAHCDSLRCYESVFSDPSKIR